MKETDGYPSIRLAILGMTERGMSPPQIAKELGVFKTYIYNTLTNKKPFLGIPSTIECAQDGCDAEAKLKGLCKKHYNTLYARDYRKLNAEKTKSVQRELRNKNREKINDRQYSNYHEGGGRTAAQRYYAKNKDKISAINKARRRPTDLDGWAKRVRIKTIVSVACRRLKDKDPGEGLSIAVVLPLVEKAYADGDVKFDNPISAPSPDRLDNSVGYSADNIQIVPMWLNYAYHDWDKAAVEAEILEWAAKRLGK